MKKTLIKILNIVVDVIVVMILITSILVVTMTLTSQSSGIPNVFGYAPVTVLSDSMKDTFKTDDLIICQVTDDFYDDYQVGDVVTFRMTKDEEVVLNTHRIVEICDIEGKPYKDGKKYYRTQGDNKETNAVPDDDLQTGGSILAKYTGTKFGGVGGFLNYLQTQQGFFLIVLLPMILFFLYQAVRVIMNIIGYNKEKAMLQAQEVINNSDLTEEQKKRAIEEYLASKNKKPDENSDSAQSPEEQPNEEPSDNAAEADEKPEEAQTDETKEV